MFGWATYLVIATATVAAAKDTDPVSIPVPSSDRLFEFLETPESGSKDLNGVTDYYGEKLFVRLHGSSGLGLFLRENSRYMNVQWAPHSHLLGVEDHWDTHSSMVYVYEIGDDAGRQKLQARLVFCSPDNDYDRKWFIEGWDSAHRKIRLHLEQRGNDAILGHESWPPLLIKHQSFVIGTEPVHDEDPND